MPGII